jgi:hypothetical protein
MELRRTGGGGRHRRTEDHEALHRKSEVNEIEPPAALVDAYKDDPEQLASLAHDLARLVDKLATDNQAYKEEKKSITDIKRFHYYLDELQRHTASFHEQIPERLKEASDISLAIFFRTGQQEDYEAVRRWIQDNIGPDRASWKVCMKLIRGILVEEIAQQRDDLANDLLRSLPLPKTE